MLKCAHFLVIISVLHCCNGNAGERSRKYCSETHTKISGRFRRIAGGYNASENEFPHMVALHYDHRYIPWRCGGSLISDKYVLTTAICVSRFIPDYVKLGSLYLNDAEGTGLLMNVTNIIKHPDFHYPNLYHDIALLELETAVDFGESIQPACLNTEQIVEEGQHFVATGWGAGVFLGDPINRMQKGVLEEVSNAKCSSSYSNELQLGKGIIEDWQICARGCDINDTCGTDGGGPLQKVNENFVNTYDVHGITSFGGPCGLTNKPSGYTRISYYIDWIESVIFPGNEDTAVEKKSTNYI